MRENGNDAHGMRSSNRDHHGGGIPGAFLTTRHLAALIAAGIAYLAIHLVAMPLRGGFWREHASDLLAGAVLPAICAIIAAPDTPAGRWTRSVKGRLTIVLFAAFAWEVVLPRINPRSVGDPVDALCYVTGTLGYIAISAIWHRHHRKTTK